MALRFKFSHHRAYKSHHSHATDFGNLDIDHVDDDKVNEYAHTFTYKDGTICHAKLSIYSLDALKKTDEYKESKTIASESSEIVGRKDIHWIKRIVNDQIIIMFSKDSKQGFIYSAEKNVAQLFADFFRNNTYKCHSANDVSYFAEHTEACRYHGKDKYNEWLQSGHKYSDWYDQHVPKLKS